MHSYKATKTYKLQHLEIFSLKAVNDFKKRTRTADDLFFTGARIPHKIKYIKINFPV